MKTRQDRGTSPREDATLGNVRSLHADPTAEAWRFAMAVAKSADVARGTDDVVPLVEELERLERQLELLGSELDAERRRRQALESALAEAKEEAEAVRLRSRVIEDEALLLLQWLNETPRIKKRDVPARVGRLQAAFRSGRGAVRGVNDRS